MRVLHSAWTVHVVNVAGASGIAKPKSVAPAAEAEAGGDGKGKESEEEEEAAAAERARLAERAQSLHYRAMDHLDMSAQRRPRRMQFRRDLAKHLDEYDDVALQWYTASERAKQARMVEYFGGRIRVMEGRERRREKRRQRVRDEAQRKMRQSKARGDAGWVEQDGALRTIAEDH